MNLKKLSPGLAALVLLVGAAQAAGGTAAGAAPPVPTGTWVGTTSQDLKNLDVPYKTKFVVTSLRGRVLGIVGTVRMDCPNDAIRDARVVKSFRVGRGPLLSTAGAFTARFSGLYGGTVSIAGNLGKLGAAGSISASAPTCSGKGRWTGRRR